MKFKSTYAFSTAAILTLVAVCTQSAGAAEARKANNLWEHSNLVACVVNKFDAKARGAEEQAQMFNRLGITKFAYNWAEANVPTFDAAIDALQKHGITLQAWVLYGSNNAHFQLILDTFKRHNVHPQIWVEESPRLSVQATPQEQQQRVNDAADKFAVLAKQAAPYGVKIVLYNHNGWIGMEENQIAIIARLKELGVTDVGMVYNFTHARDKDHDDSKNFPALWAKMKEHVVEVNITGMNMDDNKNVLYPSQGDSEVDMLRTIQQSGWRGPIGITAEKGGDAEVTLGNYIIGLDWIAAELKKPGSGGPKPFPPAPQLPR